jgi:hypothetical protein
VGETGSGNDALGPLLTVGETGSGNALGPLFTVGETGESNALGPLTVGETG